MEEEENGGHSFNQIRQQPQDKNLDKNGLSDLSKKQYKDGNSFDFVRLNQFNQGKGDNFDNSYFQKISHIKKSQDNPNFIQVNNPDVKNEVQNNQNREQIKTDRSKINNEMSQSNNQPYGIDNSCFVKLNDNNAGQQNIERVQASKMQADSLQKISDIDNKNIQLEDGRKSKQFAKQISFQKQNSSADPPSLQNSSYQTIQLRSQQQAISTNISSQYFSNNGLYQDNINPNINISLNKIISSNNNIANPNININKNNNNNIISNKKIINESDGYSCKKQNQRSQISIEAESQIKQMKRCTKEGGKQEQNGSESSKYSQRQRNQQLVSGNRMEDEMFGSENDLEDAFNESHKQQKENNNRQLKRYQDHDQANSVRTLNTDLHSKKQALVQEIMQKKPPLFAAVFIQIGKQTAFLVFLLSIISFILSFTQMTSLQYDNNNTLRLPAFIHDFMKIITNVELARIIKGWNLDNSQGFNYELLKSESLLMLSDFKDQVKIYTDQGEKQSGIQFFNDETIDIIQTGELSHSSDQSIQQRFLCSLHSFFYYGYAYINDYQDKYSVQAPIYQNYLVWNTSIKQFYSTFQEDIQKREDDNWFQQLIVLIMICIITFISIAIILPINYSVEMRKEELLKLICTYPPEKLQSYLQTTEKAIGLVNTNQLLNTLQSQSKSHRQQSLQTPNRNCMKSDHTLQNKPITKFLYKQKKKTISQTSSLQKVNFESFLLALLTFFLLLLQPILFYSMTSEYYNQIEDSMKILDTLNTANIHMSESYSTYFIQINQIRIKSDNKQLDDQYPADLQDKILTFYNQLIEQIDSIDKQMYILQKQIEDNKSLTSQEKSEFIEIIRDDICTLTQKYMNIQQITTQYPGFTVCNTPLYNSTLKSGIILTLNKLNSIFKSSVGLLSERDDLSVIKQKLLEENNEYSYEQMVIAQENVDISMNVIAITIAKHISDDIAYLQQLNIILFVLYLGLLTTIYSFLWHTVINNITHTFFSVQYLLTFFSIHQILENSYLSNYLNKSNQLNHNS